jgi:hypothetical protein
MWNMLHLKLILLGDTPLTDISVTLSINDEFGIDSMDKFAIGNPELTFISSVDGSGTLSSKTTGKAEVILSLLCHNSLTKS